jgi:hypothetical protein
VKIPWVLLGIRKGVSLDEAEHFSQNQVANAGGIIIEWLIDSH